MTAFYKFCWALWILGTVLIVLSWNAVVSVEVGWVGFGIAFAGAGLSFFAPVLQNLQQRRRAEHQAAEERAFPDDERTP